MKSQNEWHFIMHVIKEIKNSDQVEFTILKSNFNFDDFTTYDFEGILQDKNGFTYELGQNEFEEAVLILLNDHNLVKSCKYANKGDSFMYFKKIGPNDKIGPIPPDAKITFF